MPAVHAVLFIRHSIARSRPAAASASFQIRVEPKTVHLPRDEGKFNARPFSIRACPRRVATTSVKCSRPVSLQVHRTRGVVRIWNSCATNHDFPALSAKTDRHDLDSHVFRGFDRLKISLSGKQRRLLLHLFTDVHIYIYIYIYIKLLRFAGNC